MERHNAAVSDKLNAELDDLSLFHKSFSLLCSLRSGRRCSAGIFLIQPDAKTLPQSGFGHWLQQKVVCTQPEGMERKIPDRCTR